MDEVVKLISNVGFPIAMCVYVLFVLKTNLDRILEQMTFLVSEQKHLCDILKEVSHNISIQSLKEK